MDLETLLKNNNNDYCIVGNSPKEINSNNGHKIDSHKLIFRFNDFSLLPKFNNDYGKNVNVWMRGTNDKLIYTMDEKKLMLSDFDLIILRAKDIRNKNFRSFCKKNGIILYILPIENEISLTKELGFCPSTGLLLIYSIKKIIGKIDNNRIYGFSFCMENREKDKSGKQIHYYNDNNLINPETGSIEKIKNTFLISKHNWKKEEDYFFDKILRG